jgi:phenylpyruvate tautomerase PptA (4-oxalocrotonate tautomerase family)
MPLVTITIMKGRSKEFKKAIMAEVHEALVVAFKIPDHDRNQRMIEIEPENFQYPVGNTENFITIEMTVFPGRSLHAKKTLYKEIATRLLKLKVPPNDILIILHEPPLENWGIRGGYPASEVNIGFKIDV